jgi:hypothetical protein
VGPNSVLSPVNLCYGPKLRYASAFIPVPYLVNSPYLHKLPYTGNFPPLAAEKSLSRHLVHLSSNHYLAGEWSSHPKKWISPSVFVFLDYTSVNNYK